MNTTNRYTAANLLAVGAFWIMATVGFAQTTHTNLWTADGGDGQWTNAANWSLGVVPQNDEDNHYVVVFGDLPTEEAQNITLTSLHNITRIIMEATGNRHYTVSGSDLWFDLPQVSLPGEVLRIEVTETANANLTLQNRLRIDERANAVHNYSSQSLLTFSGNIIRNTGSDRRILLRGEGDILFNHQVAPNFRYLVLNDDLNVTTDTANLRIAGDGLGGVWVEGANINLSLISDLTEDLAFRADGAELKVRAAGGGSENRVLTTIGAVRYWGATSGILRIVENEAGTTGDFILRLDGDHEHQVPIATRAGSVVEVTNAVSAAFVHAAGTDAMVISGLGSLRKIGDGILDIQTDQEYTGNTWVNGGTLLVNGSLHVDSAVLVASNAVLGGSGTLGNVTLAAGGILAPGNSIGTLTVNDLSLDANAVLDFELGAPDTAHDQVIVEGDLVLGGILNVTDAGGLDVGIYTLFTYAGDLTDNGVTLGELPDTYTYQLFATGGEVNLQVIPEPSSLLLLSLALGGGLMLKRHRAGSRPAVLEGTKSMP